MEDDKKNLPTIRLANLPTQELEAILDNAIQSYGEGDSIYFIAARLGVEHTTLYRHLVRHREQEWREAKLSRALVEVDTAEDDLKTAPDGLALSRARERVRAAQWQLERLWRKMYGQDVQQGVGNAVQININLRRDPDQPLDVVVEPG